MLSMNKAKHYVLHVDLGPFYLILWSEIAIDFGFSVVLFALYCMLSRVYSVLSKPKQKETE